MNKETNMSIESRTYKYTPDELELLQVVLMMMYAQSNDARAAQSMMEMVYTISWLLGDAHIKLGTMMTEAKKVGGQVTDADCEKLIIGMRPLAAGFLRDWNERMRSYINACHDLANSALDEADNVPAPEVEEFMRRLERAVKESGGS